MLAVVLGWLALAWAVFLVIDIFAWVNPGLDRPIWMLLFNDSPVEWTQWFVMAFAIITAAYLSGRLSSTGQQMAARFFLLLAIGLGLMLIEEAGDIRHVISAEVRNIFGQTIFGIHHRVVSDLPYFAALAAIPLYAILRYGRYAWRSVAARKYLVAGVATYAIVAASNALRHLDLFYIQLGDWIDANIFAGRFPIPYDWSQTGTHFFLVDSVIEETVELLAITLLFAAMLAYAQDFRRGRLKRP
jgi:hypothetical protein